MTTTWSSSLALLDPFPPFNEGDAFELCLNLAYLPTGLLGSATNVLASLSDGDFDVRLRGRAIIVDYLELRVTECCSCELTVECCGANPTMPAATSKVAVATNFASGTERFVVSLVDLATGCGNALLGWTSAPPGAWEPPIFHNAGQGANEWSIDNLGSVFGITLDKFGNIYTTASSCYSVNIYQGPATGGEVWKINGATGVISLLTSLPNTGEGLGNITYDCHNDALYVSNLDDGMIYGIFDINGPFPFEGPIFDHGVQGRNAGGLTPMPDDPVKDFIPRGRRVWGVQMVHGTKNGQPLSRLFYGVWWESLAQMEPNESNEVWSVGFDASGSILPSTARREISILPLFGNTSGPPSDISFKPDGRMLVAERSMSTDELPTAHSSRLLEYACISGTWTPQNPGNEIFDIGSGDHSSAGGVDFDYGQTGGLCAGRVWGTADALHLGSPNVYGLAGLPSTGGDTDPPPGTPTCILIDLDANYSDQDKMEIGDVEISCPSCNCVCYADPQCDGVRSDVLDVVLGVNVAFRNVQATLDPGCPFERSDVDCNGFTDVIDVVKLVSVAFRNGNPATEFCNPCP